MVNVWQIGCGLAPNIGAIIAFRFLGGLSSAGGSVTLGMVADMWEPDEQQYAVAFVVFSSVAGSVVGPVVGGFIEQFLHWRWNFWIQLIFGGVVQLVHLLVVPETRSTVLVDKEAKRIRKAHPNEPEKWVYGPSELQEHRFEVKEVLKVMTRPFIMLACEPIVLSLSLFSGFSDALIFTFLSSYSYVFGQWNFSTIALGLAFIP